LEAKPTDETLKMVADWLPSVDTRLFSTCIDALKIPAPPLRRIILGKQLRSQLSIYARQSRISAWWSGLRKFSLMALGRLTASKRGMILQSGGAVIAFVGPEATGKSTLLAEVAHWLGEHFAVYQAHAGKPKSTLLTFLPSLLIPALRFLLPSYRPSRIETEHIAPEQSPKVFPLISALRSVFLAYDRRALLTRMFARAANGHIVLCDRYPSLSNGASDSPQLQQSAVSQSQYPLQYRLAGIEKRLYREIPPPDLVISLSVPVEVALRRNKIRGKEEPEDYVRLRHLRSSGLDFGNTPICEINTDQPLAKTVLEVKKAIWDAL
jgi:thymidylate kinase